MGAAKTSLNPTPDSSVINIPSLAWVPYVAEDSPAVLSMSAGVETDSKLSDVGNQAVRKSMTLKLHSREESDTQSGNKQGGHVLSPAAAGEPTMIEEQSSSLIETHSIHEYCKGLPSFLSTGEAALKPEKQLEKEQAKSALATTVSPLETQLHGDNPANTFQAAKTSLLEAVQPNTEADSLSSDASSSSDTYYSFSSGGFEQTVTSDSPLTSSELTKPHIPEWKPGSTTSTSVQNASSVSSGIIETAKVGL